CAAGDCASGSPSGDAPGVASCADIAPTLANAAVAPIAEPFCTSERREIERVITVFSLELAKAESEGTVRTSRRNARLHPKPFPTEASIGLYSIDNINTIVRVTHKIRYTSLARFSVRVGNLRYSHYLQLILT